ncbi:MAG: phenylacetate-CoA oxygenase subunit PaaC [Gemmatimonadetes bacterium]|nr:phenylacetate-CoA oxygenase subunit PaaC [Gemmatimonadota bacterium]
MGYGTLPDEPEFGAGSDAPAPVAPLSDRAAKVVRTATSGIADNPHVEYLLRLADDRLILGQRLSEWCGHAPILEEDIALANIALDLIGEASLLLAHAGELEGHGRTNDQLAYFRDETAFRNVQLVELPNGDFAETIARVFFFSALQVPLLEQLERSTDATLAGIAAKARKEATYHLRHAGDWMLKLGDGTDESHARLQRAVEHLWPYVHELTWGDAVDDALAASGVAADVRLLAGAWRSSVERVAQAATIALPADGWKATGGRIGRHTEHLGHVLAELQSLTRAHPGATW